MSQEAKNKVDNHKISKVFNLLFFKDLSQVRLVKCSFKCRFNATVHKWNKKKLQRSLRDEANVEIINFQRVPFIYFSFLSFIVCCCCRSFLISLLSTAMSSDWRLFEKATSEIVYGNGIQFDIDGYTQVSI